MHSLSLSSQPQPTDVFFFMYLLVGAVLSVVTVAIVLTGKRTSRTNSQAGQDAIGEDPRFVERLEAQAEKTRNKRVTEKTSKTYAGYVKAYHDFCILHGLDTPDVINTQSPHNLKLFLCYKCETEQKKHGTGEKIRDSLTDYYRHVLQQRDSWDHEKGEGNPCHSNIIKSYLKGLKREKIEAGEETRRAAPFSYLDLAVVVSFLNTDEARKKFGRFVCLYMKAATSLAFYLFLRIDELLDRKRHEIILDLMNDDGDCYHDVVLPFRKNTHEPSHFHIHQKLVPGEEKLNPFQYLKEYLSFCEAIGHELREGEYLFPCIDKTRKVRFGEKIGDDQFKKLLNEICVDAGVEKIVRERKTYTLHCFRRGGAQHKFMFSSIVWSLWLIKWWGGWSLKEKNTVIILYLLDELTTHENEYPDAYHPDFKEPNKIRVNDVTESEQSQKELIALSHSSKEQMTLVHSSLGVLLQKLNNMENEMSSLRSDVSIMKKNMGGAPSKRPGMLVNSQRTPSQAPAHESDSDHCASDGQVAPDDLESNPIEKRLRVVDDTDVVAQFPRVRDWKDAVMLYNYGDPTRHVMKPMRLWSRFEKNQNKSSKVTISNMKKIADEYMYHGSEEAFVNAYQDSLGMNKLTKAITDARKKRKLSSREI